MFIYVFLAKKMYAKNTQLALKLLGTNCLFVLAHHKQGLLQRIVVVPLQKKNLEKPQWFIVVNIVAIITTTILWLTTINHHFFPGVFPDSRFPQYFPDQA